MPTTNEELRDRFLSHQIGIRRLATSELAKVLRILDHGEKELRRELAIRLATFELQAGSAQTPIGILRLERMLEDH